MNTRIVAAAAGAVLALGIGVGVNQAMAEPSPSPSASPSASTTSSSGTDTGQGRRGHGEHGGHRERGDTAERADVSSLATKLGVDEARLRTAIREVRDALPRPDQDASQTEAERGAARAEHEAAFAKALAAKLNLDESKVTTALGQIRTERNAERAAALKPRLDAAIKAGALTQAEADAVTKAVKLGVLGGGR